MFLFNRDSRYNFANLITYLNISLGIIAIYFIFQKAYFIAIVLVWIAGACDILDGKVARRYNLSSDFGVQLDSFADFISFVITPSLLLFVSLQENLTNNLKFVLGVVFLFYIISGVGRLIIFNLTSNTGKVEKYFEGVPTPMGAILIWVLYLIFSYGIISNVWIIASLVLFIAWSLNSKIKIPHP